MNAPMHPEHGHPAGASLSSSLLSFARLLVVVAAPIAGYAYAAPVHPVTSPTYGTEPRGGIVVLPFDLTSTSLPLPDLRDAIQDLLTSRLEAEGASGVFDPRVEQAVLGKIEGTPERLVVEARLMSVVDGATKALARVEGTADRLPALTDQLAVHVLATRAARDSAELAAMSATSLPALRAYLAGRHAYRRGRLGANSEAAEHFGRALFLDSTFALAGLRLAEIASRFGMAERDERWKLESIWRQRDRLGPADRAMLAAYLGPEYPRPATLAELVGAAEHAALVAPHRSEAWHMAGVTFFRFGPRIGYPGWHQRSTDAFRRAVALDSTEVFPVQYLVLLSALAGDTAEVRRYAELHRSANSAGGHQTDFIYWVAAVALGDSAALARLRVRFADMTSVSLQSIIEWSENLGVGLDDADRAARAFDEGFTSVGQRRSVVLRLVPYMLNRGRPAAASRVLSTSERGFGQAVDVGVLEFRIYAALYWDGDSSEAAAAAGAIEAYLGGGLLEPGQLRDRASASCALAHWRLAANDLAAADAAVRDARLPSPPAGPRSRGSSSLCIAAVEAQLAAARSRPDAAAALDRLNALLAAGSDVQYLMPSVATVIAARLYGARGELNHALALARRRTFWWNWMLSTPLREEARLATLGGDYTGALRAYRRYLALRSAPEPAVRRDVERVRAEIERLEEVQARRP